MIFSKYLFRKQLLVAGVLVTSCFTVLQLTGSCTGAVQQKVTAENKLLLGRYLFYDRRLSVNNTRSCGTCHNPQFAFTDGYKRSLGAFADLHQRNTEPLFNLTSLKYFTAADSTLHNAVQQMNNPLFNEHPSEMGMKGSEEKIIARLKADKKYPQLFKDAGLQFSIAGIEEAISIFIESLRSDHSPYDRYVSGETNAISLSAKAGMRLFFSDALQCSSCHGGFNFSSPKITNAKGDTLFYFNTGLYNTDRKGSYPAYDQGLFALTKNSRDMGAFRVPSLRNLLYTAPYFHDGSAASLSEVIDSYAAGGRKIATGIYAGDGTKNPYKHPFIKGFAAGAQDKANLLHFLLSLSDSSFINNPAYQNPFTEDETEKKY